MSTTTKILLCTKSCGQFEKVQLILAKKFSLGRMYVLMKISAGNSGQDFAFIYKFKYLQWACKVVWFYLQSISFLEQKYT